MVKGSAKIQASSTRLKFEEDKTMKINPKTLAFAIPALLIFSACQAQFQATIPTSLNGTNASTPPNSNTASSPSPSASPSGSSQPDPIKNVPVKMVQIMSGDNLVVNQGDKVDVSAMSFMKTIPVTAL